MKRSPGKPIVLSKVSRAVRLPRHLLSPQLQRVLEAIDKIHLPKNLRTISVVMDSHVIGGEFDPGLYTINLNPSGSHPELSLLHEVGHYLEWRSIPKDQSGPRDFASDPRFAAWLATVFDTAVVQRLLQLLKQQEAGSKAFNDIAYMLLPNELWTRSYSCYIVYMLEPDVLFQQIAAENKVVTGNIRYNPYWSKDEFVPIQEIMDATFAELGWSK